MLANDKDTDTEYKPKDTFKSASRFNEITPGMANVQKIWNEIYQDVFIKNALHRDGDVRNIL